MGWILEGEIIHVYQKSTKADENGQAKKYDVYQCIFPAGDRMENVSIKDFNNLNLPKGPCRIAAFQTDPRIYGGRVYQDWMTVKEQPVRAGSERPPLEAVGGKKGI